MTTVLFVCIHNSARSQMAEAFLNRDGRPAFAAESAGLEPGRLNPLAVHVMREAGIDLSRNATKSVGDIVRAGKRFDYVITVCDETNGERCPVFPGGTRRLHWTFADPSSFDGNDEERLARTREVRDAIESRVREFLAGGAPRVPH